MTVRTPENIKQPDSESELRAIQKLVDNGFVDDFVAAIDSGCLEKWIRETGNLGMIFANLYIALTAFSVYQRKSVNRDVFTVLYNTHTIVPSEVDSANKETSYIISALNASGHYAVAYYRDDKPCFAWLKRERGTPADRLNEILTDGGINALLNSPGEFSINQLIEV